MKVSPIHDKFLELKDLYVPLRIQKDLTTVTESTCESDMKESVKSLRDIFQSNETFAERIFITGESGSGKTMLCLKLLESWLNANRLNKLPDGCLEEVLVNFDLLFYVPLRDFTDGSASLQDMICKHLSKGDPVLMNEITQVLNSRDIRCFVIADGVDEWASTKVGLDFPDTHGLVNSVILSTMRPWVLSNMQLKMNENDTAYEVLGLDPDHIGDMISTVLVNFCGLPTNSFEYNAKWAKYSKTITCTNLNTILNPMMLLALILLWNEGGNDDKSQNMSRARLHLSMIEVMIQRAETKDNDVKYYIKNYLQRKEKLSLAFVRKLADVRYMSYMADVLLPFCKLAHDGLIDNNDSLVFGKHQLEEKLSSERVKLALKIGFITERKSRSKAFQEIIIVQFLHKSIQELLAAIYVMEREKDDVENFIGHCSSLINVMKLSNLITFICGLDCIFGEQILRHVDKLVVSNDIYFLNYDIRNNSRRRAFRQPCIGNIYVKHLYICQCVWHKEFLTNMVNTKQLNYKIRHIYLDMYSNKEDTDMTIEIMQHNSDKIKSVSLCHETNITKNLIDCLSDCRNITSLQVCCISDERLCDLFYGVVHQLSRLELIEYFGARSLKQHVRINSNFLRSLSLNCKPKQINLRGIAVDENSLSHISLAKSLQSFQCSLFNMPDKGWNKFTDSIGRTRHNL